MRYLIFNMIFCLISSPAIAGLELYNTKASPNETFINEETSITVSAEISSGMVGNNHRFFQTAKVYQTTKDGDILTFIGDLHDDGKNGDKAHDGIASLQFTINEATKGENYIQAIVTYEGTSKKFTSPIQTIKLFEPIPEGEIDRMQKAMKDVEQVNLNNIPSLPTMNVNKARNKALGYAKSYPIINSAELNEQHISIDYGVGIQGIIPLYNPYAEPIN
ncbi:MAG: hypothetical protein GY804_01270 [Alphaproteobacteria bacterium]|nr:hypothetical protein [Alphaproteobacteria bacterium]